MARIDSFDPPEANPTPRRPSGQDNPALEALGTAWRWLRRMKTALWLLGVLAVQTLVATIVPQEPNVPLTVRAWRTGREGPGELVSGLIDAVGAYDLYGSPAFLLVLLLLFTSLTGCLLPRYRAWWRMARRTRPPRSRSLRSHPHVVEVPTSASADEALAVARGLLGDRRWRLREESPDEVAAAAQVDGTGPQVAAEKGMLSREGGSLLFHTSFYVLLVGVVLGQLLGFNGQVGIVEGQSFADTAVGYWSYQPGRWWDEADHRGFELTVDQFHVDWHRSVELGGQPKLFLADLTVRQPDGTTLVEPVGGNDPLVVDGMKVHLLDWGYAPRVQVEVDGRLVHDGFIVMSRTDRGFWSGAVKAPGAEPDVGLEVSFWPTAFEAADPSTWTGAPWMDAPLVAYVQYKGDLKLDRSQNVNTLDLTGLEQDGGGLLRPGQEFTSAGVTVRVPEVRRWVGLQFSHRPTAPVLLAGAALVLLGLLPALYAYRRRLWVAYEAVPPTSAGAPGTGHLLVAGRAFQREQAFEDEFERLVDELRDRLPQASEPPARSPEPEAAR